MQVWIYEDEIQDESCVEPAPCEVDGGDSLK